MCSSFPNTIVNTNTVNVSSNKMSIAIFDRRRDKNQHSWFSCEGFEKIIACQSWKTTHRNDIKVQKFHESLHSIADIKKSDGWMHARARVCV